MAVKGIRKNSASKPGEICSIFDSASANNIEVVIDVTTHDSTSMSVYAVQLLQDTHDGDENRHRMRVTTMQERLFAF